MNLRDLWRKSLRNPGKPARVTRNSPYARLVFCCVAS